MPERLEPGPGRNLPLQGVEDVKNHAGKAAALLKALANEQRLLVMCSLVGGPLAVGDINERVPLSQSALSQHLAVLRAAQLVTTRRESQTIYYALTAGPALKIMEVLHSEFCAPETPKRHTEVARRSNSRGN